MKLFDSVSLAVGIVITAYVAAADATTASPTAIMDITTSNPVIIDLSKDFVTSNSFNDSPGMDMVNELAASWPNTRIVTVIQHGKIVGEYVRDDATVTPNQLHPVYSLTKAVAGMLFGILVDQYDTSINTTLGEFFPNETDWNLVDESNVDYMKSLSAYEILTMTTGLGTDPCWAAFNCTGAWGGNDLQSTLAWPLKTGERGVFEYTPHWEIVSYIIKEVTDLSPRELLATEILPFLGINDSDIDWPLSTPLLRLEGETFENEPTAWGLELTTTQMAKIGQLFLQKGLAAPEGEGGTQVLPSDWIETSLTPNIPIPDDQLMNRELPGFTYGYRQWMVGDKEETESDKFGISYIAEGLGGQQIVVHPQSGIVLAIQSDDPFDPTTVPSSNLLWFTPLLNEGPDFFVSTTTTANSSSTTASNDSSSLRSPFKEDSKDDSEENEAEIGASAIRLVSF
mmetsp:Transcript_37264/g.41538  ORF Transcript_37264/g.41538 Transcript_37264/m.41538 type:complete len:454 (-) Transcript_37264:215-1576(-)